MAVTLETRNVRPTAATTKTIASLATSLINSPVWPRRPRVLAIARVTKPATNQGALCNGLECLA